MCTIVYTRCVWFNTRDVYDCVQEALNHTEISILSVA
jgi:hypothetical protein